MRVHPPFGVCKKGFLRACGKPARCCHILRDRVIQLRVKRGLGENSHVPQVRLSYSSFYLVLLTEPALGFCTINDPKRGRLCVRAGEVGLASDEIKKLFDHGISCLAKLAFAACPPSQNPTDEQVNALFGGGLNIGNLASVEELNFESQTLVVAELKNGVDLGDDTSTVPMAAAERDTRTLEQRKRSTGLTHSGDEACSYESYNLVHAVIQQNKVLYDHLERYATRQPELQHWKPRKELSLDAKSGVVVQDQSLELKCDTQSELELTQAIRRRPRV